MCVFAGVATPLVRRRFFLWISYKGSRYSGVQRQSALRDKPGEICTVQGVLDAAFNASLRLASPASVILSSRTDAGVHALMNTGHVDLIQRWSSRMDDKTRHKAEETEIAQKVNDLLLEYKHDVSVRKVLRMPNWFHSRCSACRRTYVYRIAVPKVACTGTEARTLLPQEEWRRCWAVASGLDIELTRKACQLLEGVHDFQLFKNISDDTRTTKRLIEEFSLCPEHKSGQQYLDPRLADLFTWWRFTVTGKSFLYRQVRRMVGAVLAVGYQRIPIEKISELLLAEDRALWDKRIALAPADGLYLTNIENEPRMLLMDTPAPAWRPHLPYLGKHPYPTDGQLSPSTLVSNNTPRQSVST